MRKYLLLFIPLIMLTMFIPIDATYTTRRYTTDVEIYKASNLYLDPDAYVSIFTKIKQDIPLFYEEYDYVVMEDEMNASLIRVRLIKKNDPRIRYYLAEIAFNDSSPDIDNWKLIIETGSTSYWSYSFTQTGSYNSRASQTGNLSINVAGRIHYTSLKAKVAVGYWTGSNTGTSLSDLTTFESRLLPSYILVTIGSITQATADLMDNVTQNTDRQLNFWENMAYTFSKWFLGTTDAEDYKEAVLNGQDVDLWQQLSPGNVWEAIYNAITFIADAVVGIIIFIFKSLEFVVNLGINLTTTLVSVATRTTSILTTLNSRVSNTPTILQPVYQATFTIFPGIIGLGIIKFFIRTIKG